MISACDFRSDTLTLPTAAMKSAMLAAPLGDDVYGEDPTVNRLESLAADLMAKEAALWLPSGTQANLVALMTHCQRGDEYIVGQTAHCYRFEGGGAAICGGIQPQPLDVQPDGSLSLAELAAVVKPADVHFAQTRLCCLENTQAGRALAVSYLKDAQALTQQLGLALHVDGARLCNAAIAVNSTVAELATLCDSLTLCLSKGLGAPAGSLLAGNRDFIASARRWRKVLGGGLRQAGILAAAGIYALEHHFERLADDHARATRLARGLAEFPDLHVEPSAHATNMVFARPSAELAERYQAYLGQQQIKVGGYGALRFVTHLDIDDEAVDRLLTATERFFDS